MFRVFNYADYKVAVHQWLKGQPREGRGLLSKMASHANLSAPMMTQILNGEKHLGPEAAFAVAQFMGLDEPETHYFMLLVQIARAGTQALRESLEKRRQQEKKHALELSRKIKADGEVEEIAKQRFYSDWIYSGVRNLVACPDFQSVEAIAQHLHLPNQVVQRVVDFLLAQKTLKNFKGQLQISGAQITHLDHGHTLVNQHHKNWRLQAMNKMSERNEANLFFTSPLSLSREDADKLRARLPEFIQEVRSVVGPSPSEVVRCLAIDWFAY